MGFIPAAAHQAITGHGPAQEKTVSIKGFLAVGRTRWTHLAPVAVRRRNESLVKSNGGKKQELLLKQRIFTKVLILCKSRQSWRNDHAEENYA